MIHHKIILLINLFVLFCKTSSKVSPDYIQPCPGLKSDCLKKNIQETLPHFVKGIPSLGVAPLDPLYLGKDKISLVLPGGLKIEMSNGTTSGFKKCIVEDAKIEGMTSDLHLLCNLTLKTKYKAIGKILILPINGEGDAKIKTPNLDIILKILFEDKTRNDVVYREVKNFNISYRYRQPVSFAFTNLFKGNPELSRTVLAFINENWKQVIEELGEPVIQTLVKIAFESVIKKFLSAVPRDELFV